MTRHQKELRWRIINFWRFHNPEIGFKEWKPKTPQYVKNLFDDIIKEES